MGIIDAVVEGLKVILVANLREAVGFMEGEIKIEPAQVDLTKIFDQSYDEEIDMAEVKGQESVKRFLEIATAGGHNVLIVSHYRLFLGCRHISAYSVGC
jgi:magnesium chelatase family protein